MDSSLKKKLIALRTRIRKLDSAVIAFSGRLDSTFLMRICRDELGDRAVAVTSISDDYPSSELVIAKRIAKIIGIKHIFLDNSERVYHSPRVYSNMKSLAMRMQFKHVVDGSHRDDAKRRNAKFLAARRARVKSPLLETNLSKAEIMLLAKELGLPNFDKKRIKKKK
ncbi:MAG: hypothetical protein ABH842_04725 [Candidatus Micrarchaeota archaeon]